ncbi:Hypothetical predicted protein [Cloeon dipterum]|uniref:Uncharacterized protein n=1 Tax=Cloeon dipterum TaxID=197152 RepID=A0A8S1DW00_9INSE|nr:Hypothetical predicted protein [Cloeon dipterum]
MASWLNIRADRKLDPSKIPTEFRVKGKAPIFMARAWIDGSLVPGYVRLSSHVAYFVHESQVVTKQEFQLFINGKLEWLEYVEGEPLPYEALQVGRTAENEPLFIGSVKVEYSQDFSIDRDGSVGHGDTMWMLYYSKDMEPSRIADLILCGISKRNRAIIVARTYHEGYFVPGYAIDGVGYFVSKERQPFQTSNIEVLVQTNIKFADYPFNFEKGMVTMGGLDESKRIKIGSFIIDGMRFCGLVDDQNTCHINFKDHLYSKKAPEFQIPVVTVDTEDPDYNGPSSDEEKDEFVKETIGSAIYTLLIRALTPKYIIFDSSFAAWIPRTFPLVGDIGRGFRWIEDISEIHERPDTMPIWINYDNLHLAANISGVVLCDWKYNIRPIYVARTLYQGYYVPGYAINSVGYFVSKELQSFQTRNFEVLVETLDTYFQFKEYTGNHENGIVADDGVEESERIKIGSFIIDGIHFCGMVDNQNTCFINYYGQLRSKNAPEFQSEWN